jgi:hypothetical protein
MTQSTATFRGQKRKKLKLRAKEGESVLWIKLEAIMDKYVKTTEATVKLMEAAAVITILIYGAILFEHWQRPDDLKKNYYSVDTLTDI